MPTLLLTLGLFGASAAAPPPSMRLVPDLVLGQIPSPAAADRDDDWHRPRVAWEDRDADSFNALEVGAAMGVMVAMPLVSVLLAFIPAAIAEPLGVTVFVLGTVATPGLAALVAWHIDSRTIPEGMEGRALMPAMIAAYALDVAAWLLFIAGGAMLAENLSPVGGAVNITAGLLLHFVGIPFAVSAANHSRWARPDSAYTELLPPSRAAAHAGLPRPLTFSLLALPLP
ncbi:MAG: hypothetical protein ACK4N5_07180 [Myxococcales bacterium]